MKKRLLLLIGLSAFIVWGNLCYFIYQDSKHELEALLDSQLRLSAKVLLDQAAHEIRERNYKSSALEMEDLPDDWDYENQLSFQLRDEQQKLILRSSNFIPETPLTNASQGFATETINNELWRVYVRWTKAKDLQVQVAQKIIFRQTLAQKFIVALITPILIFLPILLIFVFAAIGWGLQPLSELASIINKRGPKDLNQVSLANEPAEIKPILNEINSLFVRLQNALETEKRLTADAAHELRTPLSAIKVHTQVARDSEDLAVKNSALAKINEVIDALARRVSQLLTLAKLDSEAFQLTSNECQLNIIIKNELAEQTPELLAKQIELEFEDSPQNIRLRGYPDLLAVLFRNLIENAIKHTPNEGKIKINLTQNEAQILFQIADSGPGISNEDLPKLAQRFYRPKQGQINLTDKGIGLGLSIVQKITELHNGQITFSNNNQAQTTGLVVRLQFTACP